MATERWLSFQGHVLFPMGLYMAELWDTLCHPVKPTRMLVRALLSRLLRLFLLFVPLVLYDDTDFQINYYYDNLTRASIRADLRSTLADSNRHDSITRALGQATTRWRWWLRRDRGPLYALFEKYAVTVEHASTLYNVRAWTQDSLAAFVASRLAREDIDAAPILWRYFCYSAHYPFTHSLSLAWFTPDYRHLELDDWVQAVAMLAGRSDGDTNRETDDVGGATYLPNGSPVWNQFFSFAVRRPDKPYRVYKRRGQRVRRGNVVEYYGEEDDESNENDEDDDTQSVWKQVAYVTSARLLSKGYIKQGPSISEILPRVRKIVTEEERIPPRKDDVSIPYQDMVALVSAILRVHEGTIKDDRVMRTALAKQILAVGGVRGGNSENNAILSYEQYKDMYDRSVSFFTMISTHAPQLTPAKSTWNQRNSGSVRKGPPLATK